MEGKIKKLYVITRSDLLVGDQAVQACHAVERWKHWSEEGRASDVHTIALLVVENEEELLNLTAKLSCRFIKYEAFQEEDMKDEYTSLACLTDQQQLFKGLKKLGE